MAFARFTILISLLLYEQGIRGQQSGVINSQTVGHSSINQAFQSNPGSTQENSIKIQNGPSGNLASNLKAPISVNFQSLNPQSTISTQSTLSLQNPQSISQPKNFQITQTPNFQQAFTVQPSLQFDTSFVQQQSQQSAGLQQAQQYPQNVYTIPLIQQMPCTKQMNSQQSINLGDLNIQQQVPIANPVVKQIPVQSTQGIPNSSLITSSPTISAIINPYQRPDNTNSLGANYFPSTASAYSIVETPKISTPYSTYPAMAVLSTPTSMPLVTHSIIPYGDHASDYIQSPLRISNDFFVEDETNDPNQDNLFSLLLKLLQSKKSSKSAIIPSGSLGDPYLSPNLKRGSKSSTIKSLLPLILNLLSEKREGCGCHAGCQNCNQNRNNKEAAELRICDEYSKTRDYSLGEELILQNDKSEGDIPRMVREHKKSKKLTNSIAVDSCEDEDGDYSDCSDDED